MDEIEAKFTLDAAIFQQLRQIDHLAGLELGAEQVQEVLDTFLDTADRLIQAAGYYCRQRQVAGRPGVEITLKALAGGADTVRRRQELNLRLPTEQPPAAWPAGPLRERVLTWIGAAPLRPILSLQQVRAARPLLRAGQPIAEFSLDEVHLAAGSRRTAFHELEVELAPAGTADDLAEIVAALQTGWALSPQKLSKFERGLAFLEQTAEKALPGQAVERGLTDEERALCRQIARRSDLHGRRARALLALDAGATQVAAGREAGMSERRVRYWQAAFRQERLGIFPRRVLAQAGPGKGQAGRAAGEPPAPTAHPPADEKDRETAPPTGAGPLPEDETTRTNSGRRTVDRQADLPPEPAGLFPDDTMAQAARRTVQRHLRQMLEHEPGVRLGTDPEQVHDMRVATRRLRAAMRVFGEYLEPEEVRTLTRDLRRAGRLLGTVRDMDVFREKTQRYLETLPAEQRDGLDPLLAAWEAHYGLSRAALLSYLDGPRFARLQEHMAAFLRSPEEKRPPEAGGRPQRLRQVVPVVLYQGLAAVRAYEEWLNGSHGPLERYHGLRIAGKGLRYALEFFRPVLGPEAELLIERMKALQDHLGDLQDAVVACGLLRDYLTWGTWGRPAGQEPRPATAVLAPGVAAYLAYRQLEIQHLVDTFPAVWEQVRGPEFAHLLGSSVLALLG